MGVVGATIAGLAAANAIAGTIKNVTGAVKEVGEVMNNAYEGAKKFAKDMRGNDSNNPPKDKNNNRRRKRGSNDGSEN